jgi:hypothetical protein
MLSSILEYTSSCAVSYEPAYSRIKDLVKNCYDNEKCSNLNKYSCDYLNGEMKNIIEATMKTESDAKGYTFVALKQDLQGNFEKNILEMKKNCDKGTKVGSQEVIASDSGNIVVRLSLCY